LVSCIKVRIPLKMNRAQSSTEEPTYDKACQLTFKSWMEYHRHKLATPRRHITCEVCSQDFKTLDARKRHHDLVRGPLSIPQRAHDRGYD
jgi:hypothetical protein